MNLVDICQRLPPSAHAAVWAAFLLWEHGLGRTRYGSTIGLFLIAPFRWLQHEMSHDPD